MELKKHPWGDSYFWINPVWAFFIWHYSYLTRNQIYFTFF